MLSNVFWVTLDGLTEGSELTVTVDTWGEDRGGRSGVEERDWVRAETPSPAQLVDLSLVHEF